MMLHLVSPRQAKQVNQLSPYIDALSEPQIEETVREEWDEEEEEGKGEHPRDLVWLLDLPVKVSTPRWLLQLVLCEPDIEDKAELRFVDTHGAGLFEVGARVDDSGASGDG
jgi:hypothetical protein